MTSWDLRKLKINHDDPSEFHQDYDFQVSRYQASIFCSSSPCLFQNNTSSVIHPQPIQSRAHFVITIVYPMNEELLAQSTTEGCWLNLRSSTTFGRRPCLHAIAFTYSIPLPKHGARINQ